jgi:1-acyl-sn-glycerol-3-phosphate acyltransferase
MDEWEKITYKLSTIFCAFSMNALDYKIDISGKQNLPEGKAIIASNHTSYLDPIVLGVGLGKINFVARDLNSEGKLLNGLLQQWLSWAGVIKINRDKPSKSDLVNILSTLKKGKKVVIFPEGTRSIDGSLKEFNGGVASIAELSDSPIVPAAIKGTYELWPKFGKIKCHGKIMVDLFSPLYLNKEIKDKYQRREDLTGRVKKEIEKGLSIQS